MKDVSSLHREAMLLADRAAEAQRRGDVDGGKSLLRDALELERKAASLVAPDYALEPTRAVLHRSAATFALEYGDFREAERLAATGLAGKPPDDIADELRSLMDQVSFERHLQLRGVVLQPDEFQLSLSGDSIGHGIAESELFVSRVQDLEKIVYRTAERKLRRPYRDRGRLAGDVARQVEIFLSVPRAASFAVSFRLGYAEQLTLPGVGFSEQVIDEMLECLELLNEARVADLQRRIAEPSYFRNFVALAKRIAPDGKAVRTVGLTAIRGDKERRLVLRTQQSELPPLEPVPDETLKGTRVTVTGTLRFADATREKQGKIQLIDRTGQRHRIIVPLGLMDDIVRPLWDFEVSVTGRRSRANIILEDISQVPGTGDV